MTKKAQKSDKNDERLGATSDKNDENERRKAMISDVEAVVRRTGEVVPVEQDEVVRIQSQAEIDARKEWGVKHYEIEKRDREDFLTAVRDGGNYVWNYFVPLRENFSNIINPTVARLVYLATYINGDNYVAFDNGKVMTRQNIQEVLKLDNRTFARFLKEVKTNNYLLEDEKGFRLPVDKFGRGTMAKGDNQVAAKLFIHSVRFLYENATVASHKTLGYLYLIVPYINLTYNVLCENPLETDKTKVRKMSVETLCERLGLDVSNSGRFVNQLLKIQFLDRNGDTRSILMAVKNAKNDKLREFLCVNPSLYSVFSNKEKIMELTGLSEVFLIKGGESE